MTDDEQDDLYEAIHAAFLDGHIPNITPEMDRAIVAWVSEERDGGDYGNLHIIIADQNLDDDSVAFCRQYVADHPDERRVLDTEMLDALGALSYEDRVWVYLIADALLLEDMEYEPSP